MPPAVEPTGRLVLVRHGETEWSRGGRHTGSTDVPLTPDGERDARALGSRLAAFDLTLVLASPLTRARRTAELAGLSPSVDPDLVEWDYGGYEGRTTAEIRESVETRPGRCSTTASCRVPRPARPSRRSPPGRRACSPGSRSPCAPRTSRSWRTATCCGSSPPRSSAGRPVRGRAAARRRGPVRARARAGRAGHPGLEPDGRLRLSRRGRRPR